MEETLIAFGNEIKALGEGKVGGYLVRFSTAADPDLTNDYFTKDTDLHIPADLPVLYNHGLDRKMGKRVIGKSNIPSSSAIFSNTLKLNHLPRSQVVGLKPKPLQLSLKSN